MIGQISAAGMKMLERLFVAEVEGRLPLQSKAKILGRLEAEGYAQRMKREYPADRLGQIVVEGWCLTLLGNMTYCMSCDRRSADDGKGGNV